MAALTPLHLAHGSDLVRVHAVHGLVYAPLVGYLSWRVAREWRATRSTPRRADAQTAVPLVVTMSIAAASLHALAVPAHLAQGKVVATFFVTAAAAQLGWAVLAAGHAVRPVLRSGILLHGVIAAVWLTSRTVGLPVPALAGPLPIGIADALCTAYEVAIVATAALLLRRANRGPAAVSTWSRWSLAARRGSLGIAVVTAAGAAIGHG